MIALRAAAAFAQPPNDSGTRKSPEWMVAFYLRGSCEECKRTVERFHGQAIARYGAKLAAIDFHTFDLDDPKISQDVAKLLGDKALPTEPESMIIATGHIGDNLNVVIGGRELIPKLLESMGDLFPAEQRQDAAASEGAASADSPIMPPLVKRMPTAENERSRTDGATIPLWFQIAVTGLLGVIALELAILIGAVMGRRGA